MNVISCLFARYLWNLSSILAKKVASKPISWKRAALAAEWPKASIIHATLGCTPNSSLRNVYPLRIFMIKSSKLVHASSEATQPPIAISSLPSLINFLVKSFIFYDYNVYHILKYFISTYVNLLFLSLSNSWITPSNIILTSANSCSLAKLVPSKYSSTVFYQPTSSWVWGIIWTFRWMSWLGLDTNYSELFLIEWDDLYSLWNLSSSVLRCSYKALNFLNID